MCRRARLNGDLGKGEGSKGKIAVTEEKEKEGTLFVDASNIT